MSWPVQRWHEPAGDFHRRPIGDAVERAVWVCEASRPALVLGSAQGDSTVDRAACDAAGVEVVRRRSGGGAVLVEPGSILWVDVVVPHSDPLWDTDVGRAFLWLGAAWAAALRDLGVTTTVHAGPLRRSAWSELICFAGLGPGELIDDAGRKVLGMSQRRTRSGARFQCAVLERWSPGTLIGLLDLTPGEAEAASAALEGVAVGVGPVLDRLLPALLSHLPRS